MIDHDDELPTQYDEHGFFMPRARFESLLMAVAAVGFVAGMFLTIFAFWVALNGLH